MNFSPSNKICTTITACLFIPSASKSSFFSRHGQHALPTNTREITPSCNTGTVELVLMFSVATLWLCNYFIAVVSNTNCVQATSAFKVP